ncbi:MAG: hypothetical protein WCO00_13800 [Rhodospirillaceae bacterium]
MTGRWIGAAAMALVLAGCAGPAGGRQRTCAQACNRDYDVCAESAGANRGGASFFGAGAACQRQVTDCLKSCDAVAAQAEAAKAKAKAKPGGKAVPGAAPGASAKPADAQ